MDDYYAGEGDAEFMKWMQSFVPELPPEIQEGMSVLGSASSSGPLSGSAWDGTSTPSASPSFFENLQNGVTKAWDKDPLEFLKVGLGAVGGAYTAEEKRKAAERLAQGRLDEQNSMDALKQGEQSRYNASFNRTKRTPLAKKPLARFNGTQIYGNTGNIKG